MRKILNAFFLLIFAVVLVSCNNKIQHLKEPTDIKYDGNYITWSEVAKADAYEVSINGGEVRKVSTNRYGYKANGNSFSVEIKAISNNEKYVDSAIAYKDFTYLGKVGNIKLVDGVLTWDVLEIANRYIIKINNGNEIGVSINEYSDLPTGKNSVQIRAIVHGDDSYFSDWSDVFQYTILSTPQDINYNSEEFTWSHINNASGYIVSIDGVEYETTENHFAYTAEGKSQFKFKVKAKGNETAAIYDSKYSEEVEYIFLEPIKQIDINDGVVVWSPIENATGYIVEINGPSGTKKEEVKTNSYSNIQADKQYTIRVLAKVDGKNYFSSWSHPFNLRILPAPVVRYSNGSFIWNGVDGATGYYVSIMLGDKVIKEQSLPADGSLGYIYDFDTPGEYTFRVKSEANSSNSGLYDSQFSEPFKVIKLSSPTGIYFTHDKNSTNSAYVNFNKVANAVNYSLVIDGNVIGEPIISTKIAIDETKEYTSTQKSWQISIIAHGKVDNARREIILDSAPSEAQTITKLAIPSDLRIVTGTFFWNNIANNEGYVIDIDGVTVNNSKDDSDYLITNVTQGNHSIKVRALGNGSNIISSDYSAAFEFYKLPAPSLTINDGKISWLKIDRSTGYAYSINGGTESISKDVLEYTIIESDLINNSVVFNIYAKGNDGDVLDSEPSTTGTIKRLSTPSIRITDTNIIWESIPDAISYDVLIGSVVYKQAITSTSFSTLELPAGIYEFTVIAHGNPKSTISSIQSNVIRATKLDSPQLRREGNVYKWDAIDGASYYEITIAGNTYTTTNTEFNPYDQFKIAREYIVEIRACNDGVNYIKSEKSQLIQEVKKLDIPTSVTITENNRLITITLNNPSPLAQGFKFYVNANATQSTESTFTYTVKEGKYVFEVSLIGGIFYNDIYYCDSNTSLLKEITVFSAPTNLKINQPNLNIKEYYFTWTGITGAQYHYIVTDNDGNEIVKNTIVTSQTTKIDLSGYSSVKLSVKAVGNKENTFDSDYAEITFTLN